MSTEYRRGIPSIAHVEAATRLGLLWQDNEDDRWRIEMRLNTPHYVCLSTKDRNLLLAQQNFRPIRTDGTPVDWEVLDAEVATVAQSATVTPTTPAAPTTQPQGFRADLWRRICAWVESTYLPNIASIVSINDDGIIGQARRYSWDVLGLDTQTDEADRQALIARWAVYQELKPLYDLVDGAQGEVAMPRDVAEGLQAPYFRDTSFVVNSRDNSGRVCLHIRDENNHTYSPSTLGFNGTTLNDRLANFAAVLDAVAEHRMTERMQGQTQAPTVTSAQPEQHRHNWIYDGLGGGHNGQYNHNCACGERDWFAEPMSAPSPRSAVVRPATAQPEPRRFADVRPDRHGWRWWLVGAENSNDGLFGTAEANRRICVQNGRFYWLDRSHVFGDFTNLDHIWNRRTVIPTDEQGNPVSWESIGQGQNAAVPPLNEEVRRIENAVAASVQEQMTRPINWRAVSLAEIYQDLLARHRARMSGGYAIPQTIGPISFNDHIESGYTVNEKALDPAPLPRFTADELDDVDHSTTATQDSATLKRGKLPTVEAIGKYREVMTKRNGTVAEAVKASGIDCEVAQYVLERWASGVSDRETARLLSTLYPSAYQISIPPHTLSRDAVDTLVRNALCRPTLDTSEPADTAAQRQRAEAVERQARMAALQAQLAKERVARIAEPLEEPTRFALLEVDEAADPARSIEAWKAQRERLASYAQRKAIEYANRPLPPPPPAPRRKPFEVVDAQTDGLSGTTALAVLLGRAMNGGC